MPKVSSIFSSSLLRAKDMNGPRDVTIIGWREEYSYGKDAYILELEGEQHGLKLTATLAHDIAAVLGEDDIDLWPGRSVKIYPDKMKIRENGEEKLVDTIRAQKSELDKPPPKKALKGPPDDDIPF